MSEERKMNAQTIALLALVLANVGQLINSWINVEKLETKVEIIERLQIEVQSRQIDVIKTQSERKSSIHFHDKNGSVKLYK